MDVDSATSSKPRVNGALLCKYANREVTLLGRLDTSSVGLNVREFKLVAPDGLPVRVSLRTDLLDRLSPIVEVQGVVVASGDGIANACVLNMPPEAAENFNMGQYNKTVELSLKLSKAYFQTIANHCLKCYNDKRNEAQSAQLDTWRLLSMHLFLSTECLSN